MLIVNQVPEIGFDVPSVDFLSRIIRLDPNEALAPTFPEYAQRNSLTSDLLEYMSEKHSIEIIDTSGILCATGECRVTIDGQAVYLDDNHLSIFGSRYLSGLFDSVLIELAH